MILHTNDMHLAYLLNGGDGYVMFKEADILSSTMLPDNEVVMKFIEESLNGVIPEAYENTKAYMH